MEEITVRPCREADLPAVLDLLNQLADVAAPATGLSPETLGRSFREMERHPDLYLNLVAEAGGRPVGFVSVIFYRTFFHAGETALINEFVVDRALRGQGTGRLLVNAVKEKARARGAEEIEVSTECGNQAAQQFYRRCGFGETCCLLGMELNRTG